MDHTFWYLTRASGFVAYLLLFASLVLGLTMTGGLASRWWQRFQVYDLHRFFSLFTLLFTVFHMVIVLPDEFIGFSISELLLPMASPYRPEYMTVGLAAFYLLALTVASFYARHLIGYRTWRVLHYATFVVFAAAAAHGIGAGTDSSAVWARFLYAVTALVVFNLTVFRALTGSARGLPATATSPAKEFAESVNGGVSGLPTSESA